jgi:hypothetical protein
VSLSLSPYKSFYPCCHEGAILERWTICVFPQCWNLLNKNNFASYINLIGFDPPSSLAITGYFISILVINNS